MAPVLDAGQRVFVSRLAYRIGSPSPGDLVVLRRDGGPLLIKRVVAAPGDRVRSSSGRVEVNGRFLPRGNHGSVDLQPPDIERTLGPDEYFVLGEDSRSSWDSLRFGPVLRKEILAKVIGCYWPPPRWGFTGLARSSPSPSLRSSRG